MAKLFIGIPTLNRPLFVQDTINSLLNQEFEDWIAIVSDNYSEPENAAQVKEFIEQLNDHRVSFFRQEFNKGEYGQGWFFYNACQNFEYMMILHDDDVLLPQYLNRALTRLDFEQASSLFIGDPFVFNEYGDRSSVETDWYLKFHGRDDENTGLFDILEKVMLKGFVAISGTVFRTSSLKQSGFVDKEIEGNFPFEFNLFLRLGDQGMKGWYEKKELIGYRFHSGALRVQDKVIHSEKIVGTMISLLTKRSYAGKVERRRKVLLCRLHRALTEIAIYSREYSKARKYILTAVNYNPLSAKAVLLIPFLWLIPFALPYLLSKKDFAVPPSHNKK